MVCEPARLAVGFRHRTCVSRPAGAASRLVALQTPPSTYSRPAIATGANSHGTLHEAATASAAVARGRARAAEHDAPAVAPVDGGDAQAPVEARAGGRDARLEMVERRRRPGETAKHCRAEHGAAGAPRSRARAGRTTRPRRAPSRRPAAPPPARRRRACVTGWGRCRLDLGAGLGRVAAETRRRRGARRRSLRRRCRRSTRSGAGQSRWRPRLRRARPSSTPHREPRRRRGRGRRGA